MKLKDRYDSIKKAYIKAFEKQTELDFEFESGDLLIFGEYCFHLDTIRLVVDYFIDGESLKQWNWFTVQYKCKINLQTYVKRLFDLKEDNIEFDFKDYHLMLLNELIQ